LRELVAGPRCEAPAVFKRGGLYYILSSGCSGWQPNPQEVHVASAMMGAEWFSLGSPVRGSSGPPGMDGWKTHPGGRGLDSFTFQLNLSRV